MSKNRPLSPAQVERRYKIEFWASVILYLIVVFGSRELLKLDLPLVAHIAIALTPVVPIVLIMWSFFRHITRVDELQRRIFTESLAIAAGGAAFFGMTYTFLGDAGFPPLPAWWAWVSVCLVWGIASCILRHHYR